MKLLWVMICLCYMLASAKESSQLTVKQHHIMMKKIKPYKYSKEYSKLKKKKEVKDEVLKMIFEEPFNYEISFDD